MIYFETNQPHFVVWPYLAIGIDKELWVGIGWLNFEIGWRNGDGDQWQRPTEKVNVKHKKYYALLKEYDRVCYLLDKAKDEISDQNAMLEQKTARIVDLQTHIANLEGED